MNLVICALLYASLCLNAAATSDNDLRRARTKVPQQEYRGSFDELASKLNPHIRSAFPFAESCEQWTVLDLQALQQRILKLRSIALNDIFNSTVDPRYIDEDAVTVLWKAANAEAAVGRVELYNLQRNAHCRETVMWLVHHLSESERHRSFKGYRVPLIGAPLVEDAHAREQAGMCGNMTSTPTLCTHARSAFACGACHVGAEASPPHFTSPTDKPADGQPLWPSPFPESFTVVTRVYKGNATLGNLTLVDDVFKDYRYVHKQQHFRHSATGKSKGCNALIENATETSNSSNIWVWVHQNGATKCLKLWQGVTLLPQEPVRTSGGFARSGRHQYVEPSTGNVHDTWAWCRTDTGGDPVCYHEDVHTHAPVIWDPGFYVFETYENFTVTVDKGPFQLPAECPSRNEPPMYSDWTLDELQHECDPLFANVDVDKFIV